MSGVRASVARVLVLEITSRQLAPSRCGSIRQETNFSMVADTVVVTLTCSSIFPYTVVVLALRLRLTFPSSLPAAFTLAPLDLAFGLPPPPCPSMTIGPFGLGMPSPTFELLRSLLRLLVATGGWVGGACGGADVRLLAVLLAPWPRRWWVDRESALRRWPRRRRRRRLWCCLCTVCLGRRGFACCFGTRGVALAMRRR